MKGISLIGSANSVSIKVMNMKRLDTYNGIQQLKKIVKIRKTIIFEDLTIEDLEIVTNKKLESISEDLVNLCLASPSHVMHDDHSGNIKKNMLVHLVDMRSL